MLEFNNDLENKKLQKQASENLEQASQHDQDNLENINESFNCVTSNRN